MAEHTAHIADESTAALQEETGKLVEEAKRRLREMAGNNSRPSPENLLAFSERLRNAGLFDFACRVLVYAREQRTNDAALRELLAQQHALCTYKNQDAPVVDRLDEALRILQEEIDLRTTTDQESLGLAGSIFKRKWQADGSKEHLETSLEYYRRAFDRAHGSDGGCYTGINAACVLDLLADIEARQAARTGASASTSDLRRAEAAKIRKDLLVALDKRRPQDPAFESTWWLVATVAEAHFGLEDFDEAEKWLAKARSIKGVPRWKVDATAQQLATLARIQAKLQVARHAAVTAPSSALADQQSLNNSRAWEVLQTFLDVPVSVMHSAALGKVGLALSGGGFRASLFHIGVLAALAEHDLLRHVETISCVSGGSIIGAHYYLELQQLLQSKTDRDIHRDDYVALVRKVEEDFLRGVQRNVRMRVFANVFDNWRMFFSRRYSRTQKVGELYEREIYSRIHPARTDRYINDLDIKPQGTKAFHPRWDNWRRSAKVPALVVNTSSLNSGHQWQFTASFMGEPPSIINTKVDGNYRLRRMYYGQAPNEYQRVRLGHAVGASSCVPGLFEPLQFHDLFPEIAVTLVDGGVHDNQGILSLLEQGCDQLIVSDASGQMGESDTPSVGPLSVLYRSDSVFQARMRDLQFRDLVSRVRGGVVSATYMHLKQGLDVTAKDWIGCDDPKENPAATSKALQFTAYDIPKDVQRLLADIRTDLDSFCDAEAHALMTSGYKMTVKNLEERGFGGRREEKSWDFLYIHEAMKARNKRLMNILGQAGSISFKVWGLLQPLRVISRVLMIAAFVGLAYLTWRTWNDPLPFVTLGGLLSSALVLALTAALGPWIGRILNAPGWAKRAAVGVGVGLFGWAVAAVHLRWFDRWYLDYGARKHFTR